MAQDHGPQHIRVNALLLGPVTGPSPEATYGSRLPAMVDASPIGVITTPEQVGAAAVFLASDEAASITGVLLRIDGGRSLHNDDPTTG